MNQVGRDSLIVALDCAPDEALDLAEKLQGSVRWLKVGMTLFYLAGPQIVTELRSKGFDVFVDLKLHDIPHQVHGAAKSIARLGVQMLTVHCGGGREMMREALAGASEGAQEAGTGRPSVIGVTVLTSMNDEALAGVGVNRRASEQVEILARLAKEAGLDGVVCSPQEASMMRALLGEEALIVTPGVRPAGAAVGDQSRVATPLAALQAGASHLVVGRPITQADDPAASAASILNEMEAVR